MNNRYLWITVLFSAFILFSFMGKIIVSPNDYLFSYSGDGLQTYFQTAYHAKYDTTYLRQDAMHYPFGESVFFTSGQPVISNVLKFVRPICDLTNYSVGFTNSAILLSLFFAPIFLFLFLKKLNIGNWQSVCLAVGLAFFTQQLERLSGHYTLAYICALPCYLYFITCYYQRPSLKLSILIGLITLFFIACHIYYLVFFGVIALCYWLSFIVFNKNRIQSHLNSFKHLLIQLIFPFLILQFFIHLSSNVTDRSSIPYGFLEYKSFVSSYLYPFSMMYEPFIKLFIKPGYNNWEGNCYIGLLVYLIVLILLIKTIVNRKLIFGNIPLFGNLVIRALLLGVLFCLIISFAFPFNFGFGKLLNKLPLIQQFRGIGRFSFVTFFLLNLALILLFHYNEFKNKKIKQLLWIGLVLCLGLDTYSRLSTLTKKIVYDRQKTLTNNFIPIHLNNSKYQAILPLPYFHIGSENIGQDAPSKFKNLIYNISYQSGIPTFGASMSRTSLNETFKLMAFHYEPLEIPSLLYTINQEKPIVIVCDTLLCSAFQKKIIKASQLLYQSNAVIIAEINIKQLKKNYELAVAEIESKMSQEIDYKSKNDLLYKPELVNNCFESGKFIYQNVFIPNEFRGTKLKFSFEVNNIQTDLIPRTSLYIVSKKQNETKSYYTEYIGKKIIGIKNGKAFIEVLTEIPQFSDTLTITLLNTMLNGGNILCENLKVTKIN